VLPLSISSSAKRYANLEEFQDFFNVERNKTLKLCNARWLVFHKCVVRLLDNWDDNLDNKEVKIF